MIDGKRKIFVEYFEFILDNTFKSLYPSRFMNFYIHNDKSILPSISCERWYAWLIDRLIRLMLTVGKWFF